MLFHKGFHVILALAALAAGTRHLTDILEVFSAIFHGFKNIAFADLFAGTDNFFGIHAVFLTFMDL